MEVDGAINLFVPHLCEECKKFFWILQRSWFDPFYDNNDVEIHDENWIKSKRKELKRVGSYDDGENKAHMYRPKWDIYEEFGGKDEAFKVIKRMFGKGDRTN